MKGREPTSTDVERLQVALALVTAYDDGVLNDDFELYGNLVDELKGDAGTLDAVAQLAWMLVHSMASADMARTRQEILEWYGQRFAVRVEELK